MVTTLFHMYRLGLRLWSVSRRYLCQLLSAPGQILPLWHCSLCIGGLVEHWHQSCPRSCDLNITISLTNPSLTSSSDATKTSVGLNWKSWWIAFNCLSFLLNFLLASVAWRWCPPWVLNHGLASSPWQIFLPLPLETELQLTANCCHRLPAWGPAIVILPSFHIAHHSWPAIWVQLFQTNL